MTILTSTTSITRIIKRASGNPSYEWANTYETALISGPGSISDIQNFLLALKQAEVDMHTSNVEFVRAIYSTWAPDSEPYDPSSFLVLDLGLEAGGRIAADDVLPRNFALHAKRSALTGRSGKLFYRGVLDEADLTTSSTLVATLDPVAVAAYSSLLADLYGAWKDAAVAMGGVGSTPALISVIGATPNIRAITGLTVKGVSIVSPDHKYFDFA